MKNTRQHKVAIEIKKILSEFLLLNPIFDEKTHIDMSLISINDVTVSHCLRHAKVFVVSVSSKISSEDCVAFLDRHKSKFRNYLGKKIKMRYVSEINFFVDDSTEIAAKIEEVFKKLHTSRQSIP